MDKIKEYIQDIRKEMKKVSWPDQQELIDYTIVVVVFTVLLSAFIFVIDQVYSTVLEAIYQ
ncbi:preprotein translocase subunit SecE [Fodinibius salinus]|uniref:Protein translocase subunit SecE n=1 Tax=Fodinibius salinus TaxID=860790 RepID=A0A5D3YIE5_9BACT|nr:preprotein translocase subunit SecE [Fodinibius salinus]TYP92505.1 preprotein translocase subunit SecE [Fodinibius salinus]